jgi:hypothetical protein
MFNKKYSFFGSDIFSKSETKSLIVGVSDNAITLYIPIEKNSLCAIASFIEKANNSKFVSTTFNSFGNTAVYISTLAVPATFYSVGASNYEMSEH